MKTRLTGLALVVAILGVFVIAPLSASAAPKTTTTPTFNIVNAIVTDADGNVGTFTGTVSQLVFSNVNGVLTATGVLNGVATVGDTVTNVINETFTTTVNAQGTSCDILNLDLGPIDLDLLGLVIEVSAISIDITAVPGAGNLLGNLLCAVAGLLDNTGGPAGALANLLNRILGLLGGLGL